MRRAALLFLVACSSSHSSSTTDAPPNSIDGPFDPGGDAASDAPPGTVKRTIFVIPMENEPSSAIYGNMTDAPYINGLMAMSAYATKFQDELPSLPSEPHYIWMEAGTNQFTDVSFTNDNDPSSSHSTASTAHLTTQLDAAGVTWMSYQQGMTAGTCPVSSTGDYAAKHDPMVFFQDVVGSPPSSSNAHCKAHHAPYSQFAADLMHPETMAQFVFITPDLCHDMHGAGDCPQGTNTAANIQAGDTFLAQELPQILDYANAHDGVVFITWDEGDNSNLIPFLALGPRIKTGPSGTTYSHSSQLKSIEEILGVPVLSTVSSANDFADLFQPGMFP
jgi:phosphatidylinositol-3-phosphatase